MARDTAMVQAWKFASHDNQYMQTCTYSQTGDEVSQLTLFAPNPSQLTCSTILGFMQGEVWSPSYRFFQPNSKQYIRCDLSGCCSAWHHDVTMVHVQEVYANAGPVIPDNRRTCCCPAKPTNPAILGEHSGVTRCTEIHICIEWILHVSQQ